MTSSTVRRGNRLQPQWAMDLVFVFTNVRLIEKFKQPETFAEWVSENVSDDEDVIEFEEEEEGGVGEMDDDDDAE